MCCPPDTDTPGFEEEQKSKPEECKIISGSATPVDPDYVARFVRHSSGQIVKLCKPHNRLG